MNDIKFVHFDCTCSSADHTIRFTYMPSEKNWEPELYLDVQLCLNKTLFQRIWEAIKYIFGYGCQYGHWDNCIIRPDDYDRLIKVIRTAKRGHDKYMKNKI